MQWQVTWMIVKKIEGTLESRLLEFFKKMRLLLDENAFRILLGGLSFVFGYGSAKELVRCAHSCSQTMTRGRKEYIDVPDLGFTKDGRPRIRVAGGGRHPLVKQYEEGCILAVPSAPPPKSETQQPEEQPGSMDNSRENADVEKTNTSEKQANSKTPVKYVLDEKIEEEQIQSFVEQMDPMVKYLSALFDQIFCKELKSKNKSTLQLSGPSITITPEKLRKLKTYCAKITTILTQSTDERTDEVFQSNASNNIQNSISDAGEKRDLNLGPLYENNGSAARDLTESLDINGRMPEIAIASDKDSSSDDGSTSVITQQKPAGIPSDNAENVAQNPNDNVNADRSETTNDSHDAEENESGEAIVPKKRVSGDNGIAQECTRHNENKSTLNINNDITQSPLSNAVADETFRTVPYSDGSKVRSGDLAKSLLTCDDSSKKTSVLIGNPGINNKPEVESDKSHHGEVRAGESKPWSKTCSEFEGTIEEAISKIPIDLQSDFDEKWVKKAAKKVTLLKTAFGPMSAEKKYKVVERPSDPFCPKMKDLTDMFIDLLNGNYDSLPNPKLAIPLSGIHCPCYLYEGSVDLYRLISFIIERDGKVYGAPYAALVWTELSQRKIAETLNSIGIPISPVTVGLILEQLGFSRQRNFKFTEPGDSHPCKDEQMKNIQVTRSEYMSKPHAMIMSVDSLHKIYYGSYDSGGSHYCKKGNPIRVHGHDYHDPRDPYGIAYGAYITARDIVPYGYVEINGSKNTPQYAGDVIRDTIYDYKMNIDPDLSDVLIEADGGGSNGSRSNMFKYYLWKIASEFNVKIFVCHYTPGSSKYNRIEHRLWSRVVINIGGNPIKNETEFLNYIRNTRTKTGLTVKGVINHNTYQTGQHMSYAEMINTVNLKPSDFYGQWNYAILPGKP